MVSEKSKEYLNTLVATQGLFYIKLHQAHWYIKGPNFFSLHPKLEELYDDLTEQMDETAERLLALGGTPYSTLQEFLEHSLISESVEERKLSEEEMIHNVIRDFEILRDELSNGIKLTDEEHDDVSNDMLIAQKTEVDKTIWMMQAYRGHTALDDKK